MADQVGKSSGKGRDNAGSTLKDFSEQAAAVGKDLKSKASELAGSSADKLTDHASDFAEKAKEVADQAGDKIKEAVDERKSSGADYVGGLADAMRRAGREFDRELPIAGKYFRRAASQVDGVADSIRTGDFNDLVRSAQSFARKQPTAFVGLAALAGFAAVRFLKTSSSSEGSVTKVSRLDDGSSATTAGYRDEFSK